MSRQKGRIDTDSGRSAKRCTLCGAKTWLFDEMTQTWTGPWHFQDCPEVPGGEDLATANIAARIRWEAEKPVPKKQGRRILQAIYMMLDSPNHEVMLQRKAAILEEIGKLSVREDQENNREGNHEMGVLDYHSRPAVADGDRRNGWLENDH
jgi:hypothetical protein